MLRRFSRSSTIVVTAARDRPRRARRGARARRAGHGGDQPGHPGQLPRLGFDQCATPSQAAMSTWLRSSPFRAAGIYISGNSRACRTQTNLTATWVANQLRSRVAPDADHARAAGVVLHAVPPLRRHDRPDDQPEHDQHLRRGPQPGRPRGTARGDRRAGAGDRPGQHAVLRPRGVQHQALDRLHLLGPVVPGQLDPALHRYHYASGVYSSAASGIRILDDARVRPGNPIALPDQIWVADWNKQANTASTYIRSDGWLPYRRAHQYQGGHNETWGGVRINIDRSYLDLRTPAIAGVDRRGTRAPRAPARRPALHDRLDQQDALPAYQRQAPQLALRPAAVRAQAAAPLPGRRHRAVEQQPRSRRCATGRSPWATGCATASCAATG